ncbi:hypothetical protein ABH926_001445 [Catenulispora sp. GP43]|uniref:hypothetical protein n=1 Tax=Catenulispora sp. GP43 TaxID=3156263 RepID=UPI0035118671
MLQLEVVVGGGRGPAGAEHLGDGDRVGLRVDVRRFDGDFGRDGPLGPLRPLDGQQQFGGTVHDRPHDLGPGRHRRRDIHGQDADCQAEWIARVQPLMSGGAKIDAKTLNLIALVDEAAREHDTFGLVRLSNGRMSQDKLNQPGVLDNLVTLLEKTHPAATDGLNYPGFTLDGGAPTEWTGIVVRG